MVSLLYTTILSEFSHVFFWKKNETTSVLQLVCAPEEDLQGSPLSLRKQMRQTDEKGALSSSSRKKLGD